MNIYVTPQQQNNNLTYTETKFEYNFLHVHIGKAFHIPPLSMMMNGLQINRSTPQDQSHPSPHCSS